MSPHIAFESCARMCPWAPDISQSLLDVAIVPGVCTWHFGRSTRSSGLGGFRGKFEVISLDSILSNGYRGSSILVGSYQEIFNADKV